MGVQIGAERAPYFAKVGKDVVGCNSVAEVAKLAELDWEVEKRPIYLQTTKQIAATNINGFHFIGFSGLSIFPSCLLFFGI